MSKINFGANALIGLLMSFFMMDARAADRSDIYIEAAVGTNLKKSAEIFTEMNGGYLIFDGIGVGFVYNQVLAATPSARAEEGSALGPEIRFFLEPVEVGLSIGLSSQAQENFIYVHGGVNYLFAVTPALALKAEIRGRYEFARRGTAYWLVGARLLF